MTLRVLHVDDHPLIRQGCEMLLSRLDRYELVGALDQGLGVVEYVAEHDIDIVILDLDLPDVNGASLLAELIGKYDQTVILLTGQKRPSDFSFALKMGVRAIVSKADAVEDIEIALDKALEGENYFSDGIKPIVENMQNGTVPLSPRQLAILHFLKAGETNKEIGFRLGIAMPTVSFHIGEIRKKLGVSNNKKILLKAIEAGIL